MKYIKSFSCLVIFLVVVSFFGCRDTLLKENTSGVLTTDSYYKSKGDLKSGVVGIFGSLLYSFDNIGSARLMEVPQMGSPIITTRPGSNKAPFREIDQFKISPTNDTVLKNWRIFYRGVYASNSVIKNSSGVKAPENYVDKMLGVAHFMRAWCYFKLVKRFGPVPLFTSPKPKYKAKRSSVKDVYSLIVKDLKYAENNLPNDQSGWNNTQFPTKLVASALLGRVYLTMAGWPLKDSAKYDLAREEALKVMNSHKYHLMANFGDFFKLENNMNSERIFSLQFCAECSGGYGTHLAGNANLPIDISGWVDVEASIKFFKIFPDGPRKEATYLTEFGDGIKWQDGLTEHPFIKKWLDGTVYTGNGPSTYASSRALPIIRYAHILLMFAEAQDMADGGPNSKAYNAINKVRNRAGLPNLTPGLGKVAFRDSVIREKGWEFAGEFIFFDDLVRTEKVAQYAKIRSPKELPILRDIDNLPLKEYYWWPIPAQEIAKDKNLKQNPGY